jgi:NAD+ kinase
MIIDNETEKAIALRVKFGNFLSESFKNELERDHNLIVVFGGDGTLIWKANELGLDKTYLPINGGSLGFLMNDAEDISRAAAIVEEELYNINQFMTLSAVIESEYDTVRDTAINDVYIERSSGQAAKLTISVDKRVIVRDMVCDGVIVSSPLGSTGYNKSAGGSICLPSCNVLQIVPICAHHPNLPPIIVPEYSVIRVHTEEGHKRPVRAVVDGRTHEDIDDVTVIVGKEKLKIAYFKGNDFTDRLVNKILRKQA